MKSCNRLASLREKGGGERREVGRQEEINQITYMRNHVVKAWREGKSRK